LVQQQTAQRRQGAAARTSGWTVRRLRRGAQQRGDARIQPGYPGHKRAVRHTVAVIRRTGCTSGWTGRSSATRDTTVWGPGGAALRTGSSCSWPAA